MNPAHMGAAKLVPPRPSLQGLWLEQKKKSKLASAETSGAFRKVVEPSFAAVITPGVCCHDGIGMASGVKKAPPPSTQADSELQAPPAPLVIKSVPPTVVTNASSAGNTS